MVEGAFNVLFLGAGDGGRSILAEAIRRKDGAGRFDALSAGRHPKGAVNPLAIKLHDRLEYPTSGARSKSWVELSVPAAPLTDFVLTLCDDAARETRPIRGALEGASQSRREVV